MNGSEHIKCTLTIMDMKKLVTLTAYQLCDGTWLYTDTGTGSILSGKQSLLSTAHRIIGSLKYCEVKVLRKSPDENTAIASASYFMDGAGWFYLDTSEYLPAGELLARIMEGNA